MQHVCSVAILRIIEIRIGIDIERDVNTPLEVGT